MQTRVPRISTVSSTFRPSELLHEAQFARGAVVIVELGIAVAGFADGREFGVESQHGQRPVVGGEPVGAGAVLARDVVRDEGEPAPFVVRSAYLHVAADSEAQGKGHGDARAKPAAVVFRTPSIYRWIELQDRLRNCHTGNVQEAKPVTPPQSAPLQPARRGGPVEFSRPN